MTKLEKGDYKETIYIERDRPIPKNMFTVGNGIYSICSGCGKIVKINKFIFGSLHICSGEE